MRADRSVAFSELPDFVLTQWRERRAQLSRRVYVGYARARTRSIMPSRLEDRDWDILLRRIRDGKCTPFLGAGVNAGVLPLGSEIARQWAAQYKYPLEDGTDLARVAQFLAVSSRDKMFPKEEIVKSFEGVAPPDFSARDDPQGALADLPLPVYMSTNYDDFMAKALKSRGKDPKTRVLPLEQPAAQGTVCLRSAHGVSPHASQPDRFSHARPSDPCRIAGPHRRRLPRLPGQHLARSEPAARAHSGGADRRLVVVRRLSARRLGLPGDLPRAGHGDGVEPAPDQRGRAAAAPVGGR